MAEALRRTWEATPDPKIVIAAGDCGRDGGIFAGSYAVVGGVAAVLPVDGVIPGCSALAAGAPGGPPRRDRPPALMSTLAGAGGALIGLAAAWLGLAGLLGRQWTARIEWLVPLTGLELHMDPISGFFLLLVGATAVPASIYTLDHARGEAKRSRRLPRLPAGHGRGAAGRHMPTFLLAWEIMALASYALVLHDHGAPGVVRAAWVYAVMTHAGLASLLAGMLLMSASTGKPPLRRLAGCRSEPGRRPRAA